VAKGRVTSDRERCHDVLPASDSVDQDRLRRKSDNGVQPKGAEVEGMREEGFATGGMGSP